MIAWDPATNTWGDLPNMVQAGDYLAGATADQSFGGTEKFDKPETLPPYWPGKAVKA